MRTTSQLISYLFHPAIVPAFGILLIIKGLPHYIEPTLFLYIIGMVILGTYIFPLILAYLLVKLKLIPNLTMENAKDRRLPFLISILFFFMTAQALANLPIPNEPARFILGGGLSILVLWIFLPFKKVSAHLAGMGGITALLFYLSVTYSQNYLLLISFQIVLSGIVASARLILKAHTPLEVALGFLVGISCTSAALFY